MSWIDATRTRLNLLFRRDDAELRMKREFEFHIEMETTRRMQQGQLTRDEARRRALVAFGGVEKHKEELRSTRGLAWTSGLSLDLKIGFRMLAKYPGLTVVGCLAIATAITVCASYFEVLNDSINPSVPGDFDRRIVRIRNWDVRTGELDRHPMADFATWRRQLTSVEELGAFRQLERNLVTGDGQSVPAQVAGISASAFRLVPTRPLLGRTLSEGDEMVASPDVVLLGERIWRTRLHADSAVIGKSIRLGVKTYTVVGVMPGSFGFPVNYSLWIPLKTDALNAGRGTGPMIGVFGRLRDPSGIERAQAEVAAVGQRAAADFPVTNGNVRPRVTPFLDEILAGKEDQAAGLMIYSANFFLILFLCVCAANVATLVFARTATREGEIAIRTSLGASRSRIVIQLFCESFAMTLTSGVLGLVATAVLLRRVRVMVEQAGLEQTPFWWHDDLSGRTVLYAVVLTVLAAVMVGIVPALKATGQNPAGRLKQAAPGNSSLKFGRVWTGVIVSQVALTVLFLMAVTSIAMNMRAGRYVRQTFTFPTANLLTFNTQIDTPEAGADSIVSNDTSNARRWVERLRTSTTRLNQRILDQSGVTAVAYASSLPSDDQSAAPIEVDGVARFANGDSGRVRIEYAAVSASFFETLGIAAKIGRTFLAADTIAGRHPSVVDQRFVERVLGGRNPIGMRYRPLRFVGERQDKIERGEWREIVGVVHELSPITYASESNGMVYESKPVGDAALAFAMVRMQDDPHRYIARIRGLATEVDVSLRLNSMKTFDETGSEVRLLFSSIFKLMIAIGAIALMLSTAGVHALMAFTVARHTREIGIRAALGANRREVIRDTFSRAFVQVGAGIVLGLVPGTLFLVIGPPEIAAGMGIVSGSLAAAAIVLFVLLVAAVACAVPVLRALRIEPTEALRQAG